MTEKSGQIQRDDNQLALLITDVGFVGYSQYHYGENSIFFTIFPNYADFSNTLLEIYTIRLIH